MIFIPLIQTLSTFSFPFLPLNFSLYSSPNSIITQQSPSTKTSHHSRFIFHPTSPNILRHSKYLQCISTRSRESSSITRPCDSVDTTTTTTTLFGCVFIINATDRSGATFSSIAAATFTSIIITEKAEGTCQGFLEG